VRVASGPDKAGAWPAPSDGCGSGKRVGEVYVRNRCVKPPKTSHQLEPDGSGLGAVRACPRVALGWATSGSVTTAGSGGHGEGPRRSRGDAAGV
jgi:hypothetical protein